MLVIGGRHKGAEMVIDRTGPDWVSAHRRGDPATGTPTLAAMLSPHEVELTGDELSTLSNTVTELWENVTAHEHAPGKWRLRPRVAVHVHRIADA